LVDLSPRMMSKGRVSVEGDCRIRGRRADADFAWIARVVSSRRSSDSAVLISDR
jgi:hypothetical protein